MTDPYFGQVDVPGVIYLLHFDRPFGHARHYLGWTGDGRLESRLAHHAAGTGANLLRHVAAAGIGWTLVRTWTGDRSRERALKVRGGHSRKCPACVPGIAAKVGRVSPVHHSLGRHEHSDLRVAGVHEPVPHGGGSVDPWLEDLRLPLGQGAPVPVSL